jgi:NAD(P)-dependent dehydrogenase (short-subunit alcohol dehydrogenase family)
MKDAIAGKKKGELSGKVALITGAASGIGLAITRRFVEEQASVAMLDFNVEKLELSKKELLQLDETASILTVRCDVTVEEDVISAVQ